MWTVVTEDGKLISERDCTWPDLPVDVCISELRYRDRSGRLGRFGPYDAYGFQRFSITPAGNGPSLAHAGTQLIGVRGEEVTVVEINEVTGEASMRKFPRAELTYRPELLRHGTRG